MKFLYNPSTDAPFNLALEELAAEYFEEDIFMILQCLQAKMKISAIFFHFRAKSRDEKRMRLSQMSKLEHLR